MMRLMFQCCLYMKTDLYYVLENLTGVYNLMENSKAYLLRRFPFLKSQYKDELFNGEEGLVKWYSFIYLFGTGITVFLFFQYYLPQLIYASILMTRYLTLPFTTLEFWDGLIFLLQLLLFLGILLISWYKKFFAYFISNKTE
jgi:putative peptide zinc metalloprotease protein